MGGDRRESRDLSIVSNLSYTPPASIAGYLMSDAFISLAVGPIGSAKTTASVMKIPYHASQMAPCRDGIRRSRAIVIRNCYDDKTEILTRRGWQRFVDLTDEDQVATRHGDEMVFETPRLRYVARHQGPMIGIKSEGTDLLVTPDHELWTSRRRGRGKVWGPYDHVKAHDVYGSGETLRMETTCTWQGDPETPHTEAFAEFVGFWLADGSAGTYPRTDGGGYHYRLVLSQNPRDDRYVERLLDANDFSYGTSVKPSGNVNYSLSMAGPEAKYLAAEFDAMGKARTKRAPRWLMRAPAGHARAFIRGYINGDGTRKEGRAKVVDRMRTTSEGLADDLQEIAIRAGYSTRKGLHTPERPDQNRAAVWSVTLRQPLKNQPVVRKSHWYTVENYDAEVHCVEVSTHVVLVRRNGIVTWCGQTREQLRDTTIPDFLRWFPDGIAGTYLKTEYKFTLKYDDVECEVLFRGLDDTNDVRRLLSLQASFGVIDEFREINPDIFNALQGRLGRYPSQLDNGVGCVTDDGRENKHLWAATNPPDMDTWWERYLTNPPSNAEVFFQPGGLDPDADWVKYLPADYYSNLAEGKTEDWIDVYINARFGKSLAGRPVFTSFKPDWHIAKQPLIPIRSENKPLIIGMDFGLNPSVTINQLDMKGRLLTFMAMTSDGMGLLQFLRNKLRPVLTERFPGYPVVVVGDPAGRQRSQTDEASCYDILKAEKFKASPAKTNSIVARIAAVDGFLMRSIDAGPAHLISPTDTGPLTRALRGGYRYKTKKSGEHEDAPEKNDHSHIADAHQYACLHADGTARGDVFGSVRREVAPKPATAWT